jgi:hypothetical protein
MKPRGQLIIDEFAFLRSVAKKSGLELPPEITQGREHFRKRDKLFKKLRLDPINEHHVAFVCSIVHDHLYLSKPSAAATKYGDDADFDLLERFIKHRRARPHRRSSELYRSFITKDKSKVVAEYAVDTSTDRLRVRLNRAAKKAMAGTMKLTAKREALLQAILPEIRAFF